MPEIRVVKIVYGTGGLDPTKPNNNIIEKETTIISDDQLKEEADLLLAEQYLKLSPAVITQPQIWFLLRYLAKKLGLKVTST